MLRQMNVYLLTLRGYLSWVISNKHIIVHLLLRHTKMNLLFLYNVSFVRTSTSALKEPFQIGNLYKG